MFFSKNNNPFKKENFNKKNIVNFLKNFFLGSTTARRMLRIYFLILIVFAGLLFLPISYEAFYDGTLSFHNGQYSFTVEADNIIFFQDKTFHINFFDILFTAFSAFSDTGLTVVPTYLTFSLFGKIMLILLIQIGGFGIMFFIFLIWRFVMFKDKISINQMLLAQAERGTTKIGQTSKMLITTSISIIIIELLFGIFYSLWFMYVPAYEQQLLAKNSFTTDSNQYICLYQNAPEAFLAGFFHSVSAINNAGLDVIGNFSLAPYRNGIHTILLFFTALQFILGGIGFPIIYDVFSKIKVVRKNYVLKKPIKIIKHHFVIKKIYWFKLVKNEHYISLLTKVALSSTLVISLFSIGIAFLFECTNVGAGDSSLWNDTQSFGTGTLGYYNKSVQIIFQCLSTRSAGFSTVDCAKLSESTKWLMIFLMFIGASPSSTAGGIRATTFAICMITVFARLIGRKNPGAFKRLFAKSDINQSFIVFFVALFFVSLGGIITTSSTSFNGDSFTQCIFEASSAFGTAGLSISNYNQINWFGKLYLMFLMFIGQFGISTTLLALNRKKIKANRFTYMTESIIIS